MHYTTVIKDASRQVIGRVVSGFSGLFVTGLLTPLLGPLRFSDYSTILTFFAFWSAFADLGLYSMGLRELWKLKTEFGITDVASYKTASPESQEKLSLALSQFVWSRLTQIAIVYILVLIWWYFISAYVHNPYIARWLPLGMLFSALFMVAGIVQLPLQLFWKMHHVSIALILARISQVFFLVIVLYSWLWSFDLTTTEFPMTLFLLILWSVLVSSLTQTVYTFITSNRIVPLRKTPYLRHMMNHIINNGRYGLASVFNSFHLLIVGFLISLFYPTLQWFAYVGIRWLALQLIQVLLIIPASLANSVLHKVSWISKDLQKQVFWRLLLIILRCWCFFWSNFMIFASHIIYFISGEKYLSSTWWMRNWSGVDILLSSSDILAPGVIWSDLVLACLGIVLILTFVNTVFNYIFVASGKQKSLFPINALSTVLGSILALWIVYYYSILGGVIAMIAMECFFVIGSLWSAHKNNIMPIVSYRHVLSIIGFFVLMSWLWFIFPFVSVSFKLWFFVAAIVYNSIVIALWYRSLKWYFSSMTSVINNSIFKDGSSNSFWENSDTSM